MNEGNRHRRGYRLFQSYRHDHRMTWKGEMQKTIAIIDDIGWSMRGRLEHATTQQVCRDPPDEGRLRRAVDDVGQDLVGRRVKSAATRIHVQPETGASGWQENEGEDKGGEVWSWAFSDEEQHTAHYKRQKCEYHVMHHHTQYFQLSDDEGGSTEQIAKRTKHDCGAKKNVGEEDIAAAMNARRELVTRPRHYRVTSKGTAERLFLGCRE